MELFLKLNDILNTHKYSFYSYKSVSTFTCVQNFLKLLYYFDLRVFLNYKL